LIFKKNNVNKYIPIIGSYENSKGYFFNEFYNNKHTISFYFYKKFKKPENELLLSNEEELKKCEIEINEKKIPFSYKYLFNKEGKYTIKYSFKNNLTNICCMFYDCSSLSKLDFSNFNTEDVIIMSDLLESCTSLSNLDISNFNTNNAKYMDNIFSGCHLYQI